MVNRVYPYLTILHDQMIALIQKGSFYIFGNSSIGFCSLRFANTDVKVEYVVTSAYGAALAYLGGQIDFPFTEDSLPEADLGTRKMYMSRVTIR